MEPDQNNTISDKQQASVSNRAALAELFKIATPAIITMTSYTIMQMVDTAVVSRLGEGAAGAVFNGGVAAFIAVGIMFGVVGVISAFVSQHLGAGKPEKGAAYLWNGLWLVGLTWLVLFLPFAAFLPDVLTGMRWVLGQIGVPPIALSADFKQMEIDYGRWMIATSIFTVSARTIAQYFYGIHKPSVIMCSTLIANVINVPLSIGLVHGELGMPALGVKGAAIGTAIAGMVECAIPLVLLATRTYREQFHALANWKPDLKKMGEILKIGLPPGMTMFSEIFCWWVFMAGFVAAFGAAESDAGAVVIRYMHLSFMPAVGLGIALTTIVGKQIGAGRKDLVVRKTILGVTVTMLYMGTCGLVFALFGEHLVGWLGPKDSQGVPIAEVVAVGGKIMIVAAAFQVFDAMAISLQGALRGAGDTFWPSVIHTASAWVFILGGGWIAVTQFPHLGSLGPWVGTAGFILVVATLYLWRFWSGAWRKIELVHTDNNAPSKLSEARNETIGMP